jgi:hypothetical protein
MAADDDRGQHRCDTRRSQQKRSRVALDLIRGQERHRGQERDRRDILEQQHREGGAPVAVFQLAAFGQRLQHEGGRGEGERQADHNGGSGAQAEIHARDGQQRTRHQHLRAAQPEHHAAHGPQARGIELESDDEQQQHNAEFREVGGRFHIGDQRQAERADGRAGREIPQHRAQTQPAENRDHEDRRPEKHRGLGKRFHGRSCSRDGAKDASISRGAASSASARG